MPNPRIESRIGKDNRIGVLVYFFGFEIAIPSIIDTGFTGGLILPEQFQGRLPLRRAGFGTIEVPGHDSPIHEDRFSGRFEIEWNAAAPRISVATHLVYIQRALWWKRLSDYGIVGMGAIRQGGIQLMVDGAASTFSINQMR